MKVKIAIASTDGKLVNQHFGRADRFYIVSAEETERTVSYLEERRSEPVCHGGEHEQGMLEKTANLLSDCSYVLVSRIGVRARNELEKRGIEVFELPGIIEDSVDRMLRYVELQQLLQGEPE